MIHDQHRLAIGDEPDRWSDPCSFLHDAPAADTPEHARTCLVDAVRRHDEVLAALHAGELPRVDPVRRLPPVPWPRQVLGAPVNYHSHQGELGAVRSTTGATTRELGLFVKASGSISGPDDKVQLPALAGREFHYEGEVAVVIGRYGADIPVERALSHVAGITCALDITMRLEADRREERSMRKSFQTFTPLGPALLPLRDAGPLEEVGLRLALNGELRQEATLGQLIVDVPELVAMASAVVPLQPGDVILTGTPAGVGPLADGDRVEVRITGLPPLTLDVTTRTSPTETGVARAWQR